MAYIITQPKLLIIKAILALVCLIYLPGIVLYYFFSDAFHSYYTYDGQALTSLIITLFSLTITVLVLDYFVTRIPSLKSLSFNKIIVERVFLLIAILYLFASFYFFLFFDISFRHRNRLSDAGGIVIVLFFLRYAALFYLILCIARILRRQPLKKIHRVTLYLYCLGWFLSINSSLQVIYLFSCLLVLKKSDLMVEPVSIKSLILISIIIPFIVGGILVVGVGNKVGLEFLFSEGGLDFFLGYISTIAARVSTSLYSLAYAFDAHAWDLDIVVELVSYELLTLKNRLGMLLPFWSVDIESITTISRYNYLHAMENQADRGGSTPGLLASIYYGGGIPVGLLLISSYLVIILNSFAKIFEGAKSYSILTIIIIAYLILPLFENPLAFLNVIQPPTLYLIFVVLLSRIVKL